MVLTGFDIVTVETQQYAFKRITENTTLSEQFENKYQNCRKRKKN
jgi:hypothetical protein